MVLDLGSIRFPKKMSEDSAIYSYEASLDNKPDQVVTKRLFFFYYFIFLSVSFFHGPWRCEAQRNFDKFAMLTDSLEEHV